MFLAAPPGVALVSSGDYAQKTAWSRILFEEVKRNNVKRTYVITLKSNPNFP